MQKILKLDWTMKRCDSDKRTYSLHTWVAYQAVSCVSVFQLVAVCEDMWEDSPEESSEGAVETGDEHDGKNNSASDSDRPDGMLKKNK